MGEGSDGDLARNSLGFWCLFAFRFCFECDFLATASFQLPGFGSVSADQYTSFWHQISSLLQIGFVERQSRLESFKKPPIRATAESHLLSVIFLLQPSAVSARSEPARSASFLRTVARVWP